MKLPTVETGSGPRFHRHTGIAAPLLLPGLECEIIAFPDAGSQADGTPGPHPFEPLRILTDGSEDPEFVLNRTPYLGASILLTGEDFGAGAGVESAVRCLLSAGIRVVIAPRFGPEFEGTGAAVGLLAATLPAGAIAEIAEWTGSNPGTEMTLDLEREWIERPGREATRVGVHPRVRNKLRFGLTELDEMREHAARTAAFRRADRAQRPWLYSSSLG